MKIAIYARSAQQNNQSIAQQLQRCRTAARALGATVRSDILFVDNGVSGLSDVTERPALRSLMYASDEHSRQFDAVVATNLSRFGRNLNIISTLFTTLVKRGVQIVILTQSVRLKTLADVDDYLRNDKAQRVFKTFFEERRSRE